eukprot:COSAG02_NODE_127_length_34879_cov_12.705060_31_plen_154_part_00
MAEVAAVVATFASPFDEERAKEAELTEDSNAVECPTYWSTSYLAFILRSTYVVGFLRVLGLLAAIGQVHTGASFDEQPLEFLFNLFLALALNAMALHVSGLRRGVVDDEEQRSQLDDDEELGLAAATSSDGDNSDGIAVLSLRCCLQRQRSHD